ncbi:MAG: serpin family protein [Caldilineaceae bacterium]
MACTQDDPSTRSPTQASSLVANLNTLGIDLYHTLTQSADQENLIFSPYGVVSAFSAAYAGAAGETEAELIVNRPFIYAIRETESNAILFLGRSDVGTAAHPSLRDTN